MFDAEKLAALCRRLNASPAFAQAAARLKGSFLFSAGETAAFLRLEPGRCAEARLARPDEAADFVIEADPETWRAALAGSLDPLAAFAQGRFKLKKGSLLALMPYAQAAKAIFQAMA